MEIAFTKMHGAGNDFVVLDGRGARLPGDIPAFVRHVCDRRRSVGADGVLILAPSERADFRMRYYNADGGEAEMCGNGARCISRFAAARGVGGPDLTFETLSGPIRARVRPDTVTVHMGDARDVRPEAAVAGFAGPPVLFLNTGVPHAVLFVDDVGAVPVVEWGRLLRHHAAFAPAGANVDFVQVKGPRRIAVRTYERGVEDETLACGTGITAAAVAAGLARGCATPVEIEARSGDVLRVDYRREGGQVLDMTLEGPAVTAYEGRLEWNDGHE
ncbi:MAG: diaminopimelate epimerase [Candidatus Eisenbacteria bacterium]|nr:diaminopimelate epimerase [Candidatus Eisenbacteria bacterium]